MVIVDEDLYVIALCVHVFLWNRHLFSWVVGVALQIEVAVEASVK